ncbi:MAG: enoyl-CoA hydratase [Planctomycetes bacterium]|jgi:enoyl-CoA hydratase/carnithine racemase|nr:enoyl-CoA hydratase [Planctomycetota bacterium]MBT4028849.1 enoyl-CoA hydratase [Planctomycetota bacterium]MBT4559591.1 enoyl-CoA hydratase [Planctomycetota bacterium]MBT5121095.1 enoyl-CoA hydratase [Planctomycetota bacterium]MBT7012210.1 enoyl-CoA hydratase [Planctomycetota bacterium]
MSEETPVLFDRRGSTAWLTLNRPKSANSLSRETVASLRALLSDLARDKSIWIIVITGAGDRVFCAGADLKERREMTQNEVSETVQGLRDLMDEIAAMPQPVLAAMNGGAFGGGLELALACDLRLLNAGSSVGLTETSLAIIPGAGGTVRLPRLVGAARAKELILTARRVQADEALKIGLVHELAPADEVVSAAEAFVARLSENGPIALQAAKSAIDGGLDLPVAEALVHERKCHALTTPTQDRLEALAAFAEKRKPQFKGR